jgi:hypothetical protein
VNMSGSSGQNINGPTTFNNLTINDPDGALIHNDITVNGSLTLTSGTLSTTLDGIWTITMGPSATLSEATGSTVSGNIQTTRDVALGENNTFGGIGMEIDASGNAPGSTTVLRVTGTAQTGNGNSSILRYFDISPAANTDLNATLVFHYGHSELNGIIESNLVLFSSTDGGGTWTTQGGTVNTTNNTVTLSGVNSLSRWTAASSVNPLPIQLVSSAAYVVRNNDVEIAWKTISETNNYGFEIYRKRGEVLQWQKISFVNGHGTTLTAQSYSYIDRALPLGKYYYQIKQLDLDGKFNTFPEMQVTVGAIPGGFSLGQNYPNPFNPSTLIEFVVPQTGFSTLKVYNVLGQEIATIFEGNAEAGTLHTARFDASNLPTGLYFYTLRSAGKVDTKRMLLLR